jgi:hypothetical protein
MADGQWQMAKSIFALSTRNSSFCRIVERVFRLEAPKKINFEIPRFFCRLTLVPLSLPQIACALKW